MKLEIKRCHLVIGEQLANNVTTNNKALTRAARGEGLRTGRGGTAHQIMYLACYTCCSIGYNYWTLVGEGRIEDRLVLKCWRIY